MTALSVALSLGFVLVFVAWRDWLSLERERVEALKPVPPHDELKAEVRELRDRIADVEAWAGVKRG
jgi:hypothetical protein